MVDVTLYTLGRFSVDAGGRTLPNIGNWGASTTGRLLKMLVSQPRRRLLKDQAIDLLWPDTRVEDSTMRGAVFDLREALERLGGKSARALVETDRAYTVSLRPQAELWVDADAFDALVERAKHEVDPLPLLGEANALYQGEYLPDDIYEDWSSLHRESLKSTWRDLQRQLAHHAEPGTTSTRRAPRFTVS